MNRPVACILGVAALMVTVVGGCARERNYTVHTLPVALQAPPVVDLEDISLPPPVEERTGERVDRGDLLEVSIIAGLQEDAITTFSIRVGDDWTVLPGIGTFQLVGLRLLEAEQQIAAACVHRGLFRQPHVTVTMKEQRLHWVTVLGGIEKPGMYQLPRGSSCFWDAIASAGGFSEDAGPRVEIQQPAAGNVYAAEGPTHAGPLGVQQASNTVPVPGAPAELICLNLADPVSRNSGRNMYLFDGAVVKVEKRKPEPVTVLGLVKNPQRIEYPVNYGLNLLDVIAEAGGESSSLADKIVVTRRSPDVEGLVTIEASLRAAESNAEDNLPLCPGDIVRIKHTPGTVLLDIGEKIIGRVGVGASVPIP